MLPISGRRTKTKKQTKKKFFSEAVQKRGQRDSGLSATAASISAGQGDQTALRKKCPKCCPIRVSVKFNA
jgi:hypothetical protein